MDIANDAIKLLIFLLPGFVTLRVISYKTDVKKDSYEYYVVEAVLYSVFIYMITGALHLNTDLQSPSAIASLYCLSILIGMFLGEMKRCDIFATVFRSKNAILSTHDKLFYAYAGEVFFGKWHVVGLKDGKEILGIIKAFNTDNNEILIEDGRWVVDGSIAGDKGWIYIPPSEDISYIRTLE
jgi:hypothetical protein